MSDRIHDPYVRGFSDEERAEIRAELIETGREQFFRHGPERTRVKDITDPVGIAKPTFYRFFDSKGELYLKIIALETEKFTQRVASEVAETEVPREGIERFFTRYVEFVDDHPEFQKVLSESYPRELFRNVPQEKIDEIQRRWLEGTVPPIEQLQEKGDGKFAEYDPKAIVGLLRPIGLMQSYGREGTTRTDDEFARLQEMHIDTLVSGLVCNDE
jgi:AcrR family transcriptional regulator